jgi:hypothetical protein
VLRTPILPIASVLVAALLLAPSSLAFDSPLSDQAVREAYFLGQRHDGSVPRLLDKYTKHLQPPKTGPYISSVAFFTPFVQLAQFSDGYIGNYSAQQARLDHPVQQEFVKVIIHIQLTDSYSRFVNNPAPRTSGSSPTLIPRPYDFWKDFRVQLFSGNQLLQPFTFQGTPDSICGRHGGSCILTGATIKIELPAESFTSDSATVQVIPPEGDSVSAEFNLITLR